MLRVLTIVFITLLALPGSTLAQLSANLIGSGPTLELSPLYPEPNQSMVVRLNDYSSNAGGGAIRWFVDGQELPEYANQRQIQISAGVPEREQVIRARIIPETGLALDVERRIVPRYLDLIIEPQTRVPIHYTGRALPSIGSRVAVSAILSGSLVPGDLVYTWRVNDAVLYNGPVRGQNRANFTMPQGSAIVSVSVSDGGTVLGSRSIEILNSEPLMRFYSINPLYGINRLPISDRLILLGSSATVRAEPYYLDLNTFNNPDLLEWTVTGGLTGTRGSNPYDLTFTRSSAGDVGFHVRNLTQVLQGARAGFSVQ